MKSLLVAVTTTAALLASASAHALTIDFSFTGELYTPVGGFDTGIGPGTVTGQIVGLVDNKADQTPTAIYLTSYPALVPMPFTNWPSQTFNILSYSGVGADIDGASSFTVNAAGSLTAVDFSISVLTQQVSAFNFSLYIARDIYSIDNTITDTAVLADTATFTPVSATPLPAALPLFVSGLGAIGLLGWRRNRKNAASLPAA